MSSNLPPIRRVGPAVAPKPKNIKIQAGRVVRINEHEINYKFKHNLYRDDDDYDTIPPKLPSQPPPAPPIPHSLLLNKNSLNEIDKNNNELTTTTTTEENIINNNEEYDFDLPSPPSPSIFNTTNSITPTPLPLSSTIEINNSNCNSSTSNNNNNNNNISDFNTIRNNIENKYNNNKYADNKSIKSDNYLLHENIKDISNNNNTTINLSSDSSNRPTITITARGPNSNQQQQYNIDTNDQVTYNIPVQHIQQNKNNNNSTTQFPRDFQLQSNNNNNQTSSPPPSSSSTATATTANTNTTTQSTNLPSSPLNANRISELLSNLNLDKIPTKPININNSNNNHNNNNNTDIDELEKAQELLIKNLIGSKDPNFEGVCMHCGENIIGLETGLKAMDHIYHIKCFRCVSCQSSLKDKHFYAMDNKPYCENCYVRLLEQCSVCGKPITDRILRATGKPFHPECFYCTVCKKNLDGVPFTVDASSRIHCIDCFHNKYAPRCHMCLLPITPDPGQEETTRIVALDKSFHLHCYKCEDCGVSLSSTSDKSSGCYPLDDHIYCKSCNMQRIRNIKIISPTPTASLYTPRSTDL